MAEKADLRDRCKPFTKSTLVELLIEHAPHAVEESKLRAAELKANAKKFNGKVDKLVEALQERSQAAGIEIDKEVAEYIEGLKKALNEGSEIVHGQLEMFDKQIGEPLFVEKREGDKATAPPA